MAALTNDITAGRRSNVRPHPRGCIGRGGCVLHALLCSQRVTTVGGRGRFNRGLHEMHYTGKGRLSTAWVCGAALTGVRWR